MITRLGTRFLDRIRRSNNRIVRFILDALIKTHRCGRNASITHCGFAWPGDCAFCEALLPPVEITFID